MQLKAIAHIKVTWKVDKEATGLLTVQRFYLCIYDLALMKYLSILLSNIFTLLAIILLTVNA